MAADTDQVAVIETKFGKIVIEFYDKDAPKTTANFIKLAKEGFYNGTTFHRVIPAVQD
ncbi:MAG: peptidylprolyl isomerase, partial [Gammaproteobacteria bacterium]